MLPWGRFRGALRRYPLYMGASGHGGGYLPTGPQGPGLSPLRAPWAVTGEVTAVTLRFVLQRYPRL